MTVMILCKNNSISTITMTAATVLCMVGMFVGCSSGRGSDLKSIEPRISADGQPCLTQEQKLAKVKELGEKDSFWQRKKESLIVRGGGNVLGSLVGLDNVGEYADMANDVKKVTVKGNAARDSIDTIRTTDCDSDAYRTTNDTETVK